MKQRKEWGKQKDEENCVTKVNMPKIKLINEKDIWNV